MKTVRYNFHSSLRFPLKQLLLLIVLMFSSGCALNPPPPLPQSPPTFPNHWSAPHQREAVGGDWFLPGQHDLLQRLILEGLTNNPQLQSKLSEARAAVQQAVTVGAVALPRLSSFLGVQRNDNGSSITSKGTLSLDFLWEVDLFDKLDDQTRAAVLAAEISFSDYEHARLQLAASISKAWFTLLEFREQIQLISERKVNLQKNLALIEDSYHLGLKQPLDLYLARSDLAATEARSEQSRQEFRQGVLELEQLLGRYPHGTLQTESALPRKFLPIPPGIPADVLSNRPDIKTAGLALEAANLTTRAAWKNRFPSFSLTGSLGTSSNTLKDLLSSKTAAWSLLAGMVVPVIDGGRLKALQEQQTQTAHTKSSLYRHTVILAFTEVENLLNDAEHLRLRHDHLEQAVHHAQLAEELALDQYYQGLVHYVTVLESQRRTFDARNSLLTIAGERVRNRIDLLAALGAFPVPFHD
ncbi:MAG: efflux transporter outer membrane subunit [Desulfobulbaceae bacterium]|uniref:Efflux transporter outer membrane subunit n=1 Tax=Candidatus Desulfatifera sulfidica TaxID=2841691 RepID=A0A8J6NCG2_9BACT|nr:efflux transporter outer membrane subunit [Candidatus Desulfatifera sulfidica]